MEVFILAILIGAGSLFFSAEQEPPSQPLPQPEPIVESDPVCAFNAGDIRMADLTVPADQRVYLVDGKRCKAGADG